MRDQRVVDSGTNRVHQKSGWFVDDQYPGVTVERIKAKWLCEGYRAFGRSSYDVYKVSVGYAKCRPSSVAIECDISVSNQCLNSCATLPGQECGNVGV